MKTLAEFFIFCVVTIAFVPTMMVFWLAMWNAQCWVNNKLTERGIRRLRREAAIDRQRGQEWTRPFHEARARSAPWQTEEGDRSRTG